MFQAAEAFFNVAKTLKISCTLGNPNILPLALGAISAFALELFLKCLRTIEVGDCFDGHDLERLYDHLAEGTRREIERLHEAHEDHAEFQRARAMQINTDLRSLLKRGRNTFDDFRYAYEQLPANTDWGLDVLTLLVRNIILERRQDWQKPSPEFPDGLQPIFPAPQKGISSLFGIPDFGA
jgi:hypothetical protein